MPPTPTSPELSPVEDVPISLPLDTRLEHPKVGDNMALLALSHTAIEHRLYEVMHVETTNAQRNSGSFSVRRLLGLSGLRSYGSVKKGCAGLVEKRSIETIGQEPSTRASQYRVFSPEEIFARRRQAGIAPYPDAIRAYDVGPVFSKLMQQVVCREDLTRREVLVVLCCAEGLSNAEIGARLGISERTVKSHLRMIFDKFGVRRRTELIAKLLTLRNVRRKRRKIRERVIDNGRFRTE